MTKLSVVIVCKNAEKTIVEVLQSLQGITDDIVVFDNGSTDATCSLVTQYPARLVHGQWNGFGPTKRTANELAQYDWILSLDADEAIDSALKEAIRKLALGEEKIVYDISFKNFMGNQYLKYGDWGGDHHIRIFNRTQVNWNDAPVHEQLILPSGITVKKLPGFVLHKTFSNVTDYAQKMEHYATLGAKKYFVQGKKAYWWKRWFSPAFTFINSYIFRRGFLDGKAGLLSARINANYTFLKYKSLNELWNQQKA